MKTVIILAEALSRAAFSTITRLDIQLVHKSEIEDAIGISPEDKKFMVAVVDQVADKMKGKE